MPSLPHFAESERSISLTNMKRLNSAKGPHASAELEDKEGKTTQANFTPITSENLERIKTMSTRNIDSTLREIEIDGWRSVFKANSLAGRLFWLAISILCLALLSYEVVSVIINYYTRPLSTSYQIVANESMTFPDIYICPLNSINWTVIEQDKSLLKYAFYLKQNIGIKGFKGAVAAASATAKSFNYTLPDAKEKFMKFGYDAEQFMPACSFTQSFTSYVNCSDLIQERLDAGYGKCFWMSLGANRTQTIAGRGLTITFNLHKKLYPYLSLFAPTVEGVVMHVGDEVIYLRPGSHYNIEIRAERLKLINVERGSFTHKCVGHGQNEMDLEIINRNKRDYSQSDCYTDCYLREIWSQCECLPIIDPSRLRSGIFNGTQSPIICDAPRVSNCVRPRVDDDPMVSQRVDICKNKCYPPCDYFRYQMKTSDAPMYSLGYENILNYYNTTIDNIIDVSMSYPALDYAEFQQDVSKSFDELISDLGGQVGLWLGASMVTIMQIPFLLVTLCMYSSYRKGKAVQSNIVKRRMTHPQL